MNSENISRELFYKVLKVKIGSLYLPRILADIIYLTVINAIYICVWRSNLASTTPMWYQQSTFRIVT